MAGGGGEAVQGLGGRRWSGSVCCVVSSPAVRAGGPVGGAAVLEPLLRAARGYRARRGPAWTPLAPEQGRGAELPGGGTGFTLTWCLFFSVGENGAQARQCQPKRLFVVIEEPVPSQEAHLSPGAVEQCRFDRFGIIFSEGIVEIPPLLCPLITNLFLGPSSTLLSFALQLLIGFCVLQIVTFSVSFCAVTSSGFSQPHPFRQF